MLRQELCGPYLIRPAKPTSTVGRELHVVRWVGINKVFAVQLKQFDIAIGKFPIPERAFERAEVDDVSDRSMSTKRNVELPTLIESAQPIKAGSVQIIEELSCLMPIPFFRSDQFVKTVAMRIEDRLVIFHCDVD